MYWTYAGHPSAGHTNVGCESAGTSAGCKHIRTAGHRVQDLISVISIPHVGVLAERCLYQFRKKYLKGSIRTFSLGKFQNPAV